MAEFIKDAIISISKGRSTNLRIGSRSVPHRLRIEERMAFDRAIKKGYLDIYPWSRVNTTNIFKKLSLAVNKTPIFCEHEKNLSVVWYYLNDMSEFPQLDLMEDDYEFELKQGIVSFIFKDRAEAKLLAKMLNSQLNGLFSFKNTIL